MGQPATPEQEIGLLFSIAAIHKEAGRLDWAMEDTKNAVDYAANMGIEVPFMTIGSGKDYP